MKQLLIETINVAPSEVRRADSSHYLAESIGGKLIVTLPMTKLNEKNLNGRIYSTTVMETALRRAQTALENRELLSSVNEHPNEPYVTPGEASHVVIESWVDNNSLMGKWEVLETTNGKNLRALIEANVAFGVSIRGLGSMDNFGNILEDYDLLGCDCVGEPSAQLRVRPNVVKESTSPRINRGITMQTKAKIIEHLDEQRVLIENELKSDKRVAAFQRVAQVENYLSESNLSGPDTAEVYSYWGKIKTDTIEKPVENREQLAENANAVSMMKKVLEKRNSQIKAMAAGLNQMSERMKISAKLAETAARAKAKLANPVKNKVLESQLKKAITTIRKLQRENDVLLAEATKSHLSYRLAIKEAAQATKAYKLAIREAAKLAVGKKLLVVKEAKQTVIESVWTFFTDADYQTFGGAGRPFGKMEPMIAEGSDFVSVLAGTDDGKTQLQVFVEDGSIWAKDVTEWSEAYEIMVRMPESIMSDDKSLESQGFSLIGNNLPAIGESFKAPRKAVKESKVIDNSNTVVTKPIIPETYQTKEHKIPGWL